jgi:hypothetical protein
VHDFVAHIDGCAVDLQRTFNDFYGALNTCAKATWLRKKNSVFWI